MAQAVFSSPLARCLDSARAIYPNSEIITLESLACFDYGVFAGKSYSEVAQDKRFKGWATSGQMSAFPGGEDPYAFASRCGLAVREVIGCAQRYRLERVSVITHRSVIEAILARQSVPRHLYADYHVDHGGGFVTRCKASLQSLKVLSRF